MAILAGIDEAGFGPLLGPLVVSCSAFSVAPTAGQDVASFLGADLWPVLQRSVGKTRKHLAGRLLIADSKKAYSRAAGVGQLERTVLAALRVMGKGPAGDGGWRMADRTPEWHRQTRLTVFVRPRLPEGTLKASLSVAPGPWRRQTSLESGVRRLEAPADCRPRSTVSWRC